MLTYFGSLLVKQCTEMGLARLNRFGTSWPEGRWRCLRRTCNSGEPSL